VLIAGTNGKGSTATLLASMVHAAGYRTGLYTSPHLEDVEERIRVEGQAVSSEALGEELRRVVAVAESSLGYLPTYFEALTASAFGIFASAAVDLAILEVGLGGRLDATNAAEPQLSLITEIGLEHRKHLGDSLASIAREKAGILRRGRPAIAWVERPEAWQAIRRVGQETSAIVERGPDLASIGAVEPLGWDGQRVELATKQANYRLNLKLAGQHQARNLALAVLAAESLRRLGWDRCSRRAIEVGSESARWPGRLEQVQLPTGCRVILDVAHNPDGAATLLQFLEQRGQPYDLLFGALADKDVAAFLPALAEGARRVILTAPRSGRALSVEQLAEMLASRPAIAESAPEAALSRALEDGCELLLVCGSVYLVGDIRVLLRRRFGMPTAAVEISCCGSYA
jgi:dihydrofolate synthase/folylpolyglutamate synthase